MQLIQFITFLQAALRVSGVDIHHQELVQLYTHDSINWLCLLHFPLERQYNLNYTYIYICCIFYILLYII